RSAYTGGASPARNDSSTSAGRTSWEMPISASSSLRRGDAEARIMRMSFLWLRPLEVSADVGERPTPLRGNLRCCTPGREPRFLRSSGALLSIHLGFPMRNPDGHRSDMRVTPRPARDVIAATLAFGVLIVLLVLCWAVGWRTAVDILDGPLFAAIA